MRGSLFAKEVLRFVSARRLGIFLVCLAGRVAFLSPPVRAQEHAFCTFVSPASLELARKPVPLLSGIGTWREEVPSSSGAARAYFLQGQALLASYAWIDAARSFHEALRHDPELGLAHLGLFRAYAALDAPEEAAEHLDRAKRLARDERSRLWVRALEAAWEAQRAAPEERAELHLAYKREVEALVAFDPEDPHAWVLRGNAEEPSPWGRGQFGGVAAIAFYETALRRDPAHLGALHYLTHSYENIGRPELAAEYGRRYARAAPEVPHAQHMYGHVLPGLGRWEEALLQFEKADRLHRAWAAREGVPPSEDWHFGHNLHLLGALRFRLGREKEAEAALREAFELRMQGRFAGVYAANWPEYLLSRGRAAEALEAAKNLSGRDSPAARMLGAALEGEALLALGRTEEARKARDRSRGAREEFLASMRGSSLEYGAPAFADHYVGTLEALIDLAAGRKEQGRERVLALARNVLGSPRFDSWAFGVFWKARVLEHARRLGEEALAQEIASLGGSRPPR
ncbi:MAG: hypothetical protein KatS3mg076_1563 [Candidatus Binatia bacterium]|nr:MAG: hypothetical protein KatS3mg076_1563 [Candidatus Binatia bacterium]